MPRIRTIKPEFPQSESMGRVSRDARLLFIQIWTLCDDSGRTRAASRMLASLLYPYDDDAPSLISGWLAELEREGCLITYTADGNSYLQVCNWLIHQKIDKPSKSKIPEFVESSRILANPRERSSEDQGPKDQGREGTKEEKACASPSGDPPPADKSGAIPWQAIVDAYNTTLTRLPKVRDITPKRRTLIRTAWQASKTRQSLEFWSAYFEECEADPFLSGLGPYGGGHENWRPTFDFLMRSDQVTKVYEKAMHRLEAA